MAAKANIPSNANVVPVKLDPETENLYRAAIDEADGYTLLPSHKADKNDTVVVLEPRIERGGMVVCKRK